MKTILITFIYYWEILRSLFSGKILYQYFLQFFIFIFCFIDTHFYMRYTEKNDCKT